MCNVFWLLKQKIKKINHLNEVYEQNKVYIVENNINSKLDEEEDEYLKIYHVLLEKFGLDEVPISFMQEQADSYTKMYKKNNKGEFELEIVVNVYRHHSLNCFRGDLAHELWHVKTNIDLIKKIGLEEFVKLQRDKNASSLAFRTMAEFFSWEKAMEENEEERTCLSINGQLDGYKSYLRKKKVIELLKEQNKHQDSMIKDLEKRLSWMTNEYVFCDTLAAHCARYLFEHKTIDEIQVDDKNNEKLIKEIAELIELNGKQDSLCTIDFEKLGIKIVKILSEVIV